MCEWGQFMQQYVEVGARDNVDSARVSCFETVDQEYAAVRNGVGMVDRSNRRLLRAIGADRAAWLHNLTTNHVKSLGVGDGNYAFSLDVKGRILFDLNVVVREQEIWLDIESCYLDKALTHLSKYIIMENVTLSNSSDEFVRIGLAGGGLKAWLALKQAGQVANLPILGSSLMTIDGQAMDVLRTDFCGVFAVELFAPQAIAESVWKQLADGAAEQAITLVGDDAVQVHRIEAGIAWPGYEITEEYVPAETGQSERAVGVNKGCYLGQEVVERMRARQVVARRLMSLTVGGEGMPRVGDSVCDGKGNAVGKVTSVCRSIANGKPLALAYVRASAASDAALTITGEQTSWPVEFAHIVTSAH